MTDPVTDMFNRIKNAQAVLKPTVDIPFSAFKYEIAKILEKTGYIKKTEKKKRKTEKIIELSLKYNKDISAITELKRISKPGQRIYIPYQKIRKIKGGFGTAIISTSKGLMADGEARKNRLGGEVICEIW
ncbi:30S ribosomal protein S8 [Candidatus Parcubacteria bacterium]|nr:30S ribosomal protein S8 [Candidatus Parcubacteria bacterium]